MCEWCVDIVSVIGLLMCSTVLEVIFEQPSYSVNESMGMVTIGVIANSNASYPYNVRITSTEVTADGQCTAPHLVCCLG